MQNWSDRHPTQAASSQPPKRLGGYLVEAGLLTCDQINVILSDQQATGMRFGEIVVARGWLKEQTIEWIVAKVIEPERQSSQRQPTQSSAPAAPSSDRPPALSMVDRPTSTAATPTPATKPFTRRDIPISKPLPSVNTSDNGVHWVG